MKKILTVFLIIFSFSVYAQERTITGKITDDTGEPIPGANIIIKGTTFGTITDFDGTYTLAGVTEGSTIVVSFIGYATQEILVASQSAVSVKMQPDAIGLDEVVAVGYGTRRKSNLTGSVVSVKSEELVKAPVVNTSQALSGRLPGVVTKQTSGEPGNDAASISIRGFGSALVIVDGFEASMNNLDPNEIESISVLKDAAAAVYGARAGNGVILITTKRGGKSKPTITVNSSYSLQTLTNFPKPLNAGNYAEIIREAETNSGVAESAMTYTQEEVDRYKAGSEPGYEGTDWWNEIANDYSPLQNHNISMSGGTDAIKYYSFIGYTGQTGMFKSGDNKMNRYNVRTNIDGKVTDNLSMGLDISLIFSELQSPTRETSTLFSDIMAMNPTFPSELPDPTRIAYTGTIVSPIASTTRELGGYKDTYDNQTFTTFSLKYSVPQIEGLSFKAVVNYKYNTQDKKNWTKHYDMYTYDYTSDIYTMYGGASISSLSETFSKSRTIAGQVFVNYDRVFNQKHNVAVLLLTEMSDFKSKWISAGRSDYISTSIDYLFAGGADSQSANGGASETGRLSYVGRFNYDYKSRYLFETTLRYDGSPKFPEDGRWGFFPSVSLGWRMSEESFLQDNVSWLDNLKLRGGLSKTGYDGVGAFQYLTGFNYDSTYIVDGAIRTGLSSTGLANPNITWEEMTIYNVGIDFTTFANKLYGEFDYFYRDREKILATRSLSVPNTFGATLPSENINAQSNRGFELLLGYKNQKGDFKYDVSGNISWSRGKWEHYDEPEYTDEDDIRINQKTGNWTNRWFGYEADGLFTSEEEITDHNLDQDNLGNSSLLPGDIKYIDQNDDGVLDWRDKVEIGRGTTPEIMFGCNINLAYKNFDFSALLQGATNVNAEVNMHIANESNVPDIIYDLRWTEENNDKDALVPRLYMGSKSNNGYTSDYWLRDASYVRLKALNLGYNLPKSVATRLGIASARVYFSGTNLFTVSGLNKYSMDPEAPSGTRSGYYYPQQKVYSLGVNLSF